ncbi:extensin family protein [Aurantimonas sp. Leaf443]|uniref:extensin family protein n=1 Tax=Aurantimonas sp. Leaf443 TaxID=1736378 RepID=UPI000AA060E9|nr:extensin family protein [Aurantimonas sp. Leaf443]
MASRIKGSPLVLTLAAACLAVASPVSPSGAQSAKLVWGGPVPQAGTGYVPSAPRRGEAREAAPFGAGPVPPAEIPAVAEEPVALQPLPPARRVARPPASAELEPATAARADEASERSLYEDLMGASLPPAEAGATEVDEEAAPDGSALGERPDADGPGRLYDVGPQASLGEEATAALSEPEPILEPDVAIAPEPAVSAAPRVPGRAPAGLRPVARVGTPEGRAAPRRSEPAVPRVASLEPVVPLGRVDPGLPGGRGALEDETPGGYVPLPRAEAMCRAALRRQGVRFTEVAPIRRGRACGIPHPIRVTSVAGNVAMLPAATLNCAAAARISDWVQDEVKPAARWKLWKTPRAVLNASSYRCSTIAGSRTVSEHATGNALDVRGFVFTDGSVFDVEKKGFFSFREKGFQQTIRRSACENFGTVLGPGYNYAHRDHLHLDAKNRRRVVCK